MKSIGIGVFLLLTAAAYGQPPADGFYLRSDDETAPFALDQDGQRVALSRAQEITGESSRILSENNANTQFWINVGVPHDVYVNATSYVLVVANQAYLSAGSGGGNGEYTIDFRVAGADNALTVSRYLNTPIVYRRHPGHQLRVSFVPEKSVFHIGDEVTATLRIENIGRNAIAFSKGGRNRGTRDNQYTFSAQFMGKQVEDIGTSIHFGGLSVVRTLNPGEVFEDEISLSKWFSFDETGVYEILGSYELMFHDSDTAGSRWIWRDYVSSDFLLRIVD